MSSTLPIFAVPGDQFGQTIINILAVAGSAALGYVLTYGLIWLISRTTIHKPPPKTVTKLVSALGAVTAGVVVAMLLFRGNGGFGFGPGWGFGGGGHESKSSQTSTNAVSNKTQPEPAKTNPRAVDSTLPAPPLRVYVKGGVIADEKFYLVVGEKEARDFKSVEQLIRDRSQKQPDKPAVSELVIVLNDDKSAGTESRAVEALDKAANRFGLSVRYDPPK